MKFIYNNNIDINGLRFIKILNNKNKLICLGSKVYIEENDIKKYTLYYYELNNNLEIIKNSEILLDFKNIQEDYLKDLYTSLWIRDLYIEDNNFFLLIDFNKNINNSYFESNNYLLSTKDFINFNLIKKYTTNNILNKVFNDNLFMSLIITNDKNNWGRYLFEFNINNKIIQPIFDKYIDYNKDIGHLLHNINYNNKLDCYDIIFSIIDYKKEYKIFISNTHDFINYFNTIELEYTISNDNNSWYCFPNLFTYFNKNFLIVNQDDYGKNSNPIIFREFDKSLEFIEEKYNIIKNISNKLIFNDNKKYIFLNELENKNGNRYNEIINNNYNLNNYSTHSPSCTGLYNVLEYLKITDNDSIIDIGSGKGWALTLFNLFPFKKISGIELSLDDIKVCNDNLDLLNINNIQLINKDAQLFENYNDYNYLYFYNPFNSTIFENIIKKIKNKNIKIIYNNIHEDEIKILENYNFILINIIKGECRDYYIYRLKNIIKNNTINNISNFKKNTIIFGTGKIAEVAYYYLKNDTDLNIIGFTLEKDYIKDEKTKFNLPIIEYDDIETKYNPHEYLLFAPCTASNLNKFRERIYNIGKQKGYNFYTYISSKANVFTDYIGENCFILEDNTIQPYTKIGNNCVLWSGNHIGHHSIIEDHVFITSHTVISGMCLIKKYCYLGVNSSLKDNIVLEEGSVIGMSASVTKNTDGNSIYIGIPAKLFKKCDDTIII